MGEGPEKDEKPAGFWTTSNKIGLLLLVLTILVVTATHFAIKDMKKNATAAGQTASGQGQQGTPPTSRAPASR